MSLHTPEKYRPIHRVTLTVILCVMNFGGAQFLFADDVIEKSGNQCPRGYSDGPGAYCYNRGSTNQERIIVKSREKCPTGYRDGPGHYCYGNALAGDVIEKVGDDCPRGYRDGRGHYCYR